MIFSDNIIEKKGFFLRNLITNANNTGKDVWSTASSSYGMYSCPYEYPLGLNQRYYVRYTYKFTTTNQSPTWVQYYVQGGSSTISAARINNPVAGTEYTTSGIGGINQTVNNLTSGTIYNGNSNAISGVTSQVKNVVFYDVTELFSILKQAGVVSTEEQLKTWCDNHLEYSPRYTNYDISNLITAEIEKVAITAGTILTDNFVETDGLDFYATSATIRQHKYFDTGSALSIYNNKGNGTVTHTRVDAKEQNSPFWQQHHYVLKITTNGEAAPSAGGFVCSHTAAANKIVIEKFIAKIPVGYTITYAHNAQGTGAVVSYLSPRAGTGNWQEYAILYKCGSEGSFSSGGHIYLSGPDNQNVTWYVAYCASHTITNAEYLKNYTILGNVDRIKQGNFYSRQFETMNLFPAGNGAQQLTLPSGWEYDTDDVVGNAVASIVQPVGKGAGIVGDFISIVPGQRYKLSYWVKCKGDMTSFLSAIRLFLSNKTTELTHANVAYVSGTKTKLAAALNPGDTTITLASSANWKVQSNSFLGFRSSNNISYNDLGSSNGNGSAGLIDSVSGNVVTLKVAYSGTAQPVNRIIVESFSGSTYPYPIGKGSLPTDNTWKYVEGYFGANSLWDGAGGAWAGLPYNVSFMKLQLNLYANTGTVPIKFSDIRIEPVKAGAGNRYENKIDIIGGNK